MDFVITKDMIDKYIEISGKAEINESDSAAVKIGRAHV